MLIQLYGIAVTAVWSGVATFIILKVIEFIVPLRVTQQSEIEGLDVTQHGEVAAVNSNARSDKTNPRPMTAGDFSWAGPGWLTLPKNEVARLQLHAV